MRKISLFALLGLVNIIAAADVISPEAALERVKTESLKSISKDIYHNARLLKVERVGDKPTVYIYQNANEGLLLLSADDCAVPVLGYTEDEGINPSLQWWIDEYGREIDWMRNNGTVLKISEIPSVADYAPIAPMLTTKWNQDFPYNLKCPVIGIDHCVTGCTATALAQVINYHRIPKDKGKGEISYIWQGKTLSFDFDNTPFDWNNMLDVYDGNSTDAQKDAVATLMYACGVATCMDYGVYASGANGATAIPALIENFGFDKALHNEERRYYGLRDWIDYIYRQLSECGPVQYAGFNSEAGHAFVCDGYSSDGFFHFNWGWGGMSDGYFRLTALDPDSQGIGGSIAGFNYGQSVMADFRAPVEDSEYYENFYVDSKLEVSNGSIASGSEITLTGGFYYTGIKAATGEIGYSLVKESDNSSTFYKSFDFELDPGYGYYSYPIIIPEDIEDGTYRIYPAWKNSHGVVCDMKVDISYAQYISMIVKDEEVILYINNETYLEVTDFSAITPFFTDHSFLIKGTISNLAENEYYGLIFAALLNKTGTAHVASGGIYTVDILPGESETFEYESTFTSVYGSNVPAGEYLLVFADRDGNIISEAQEIEILDSPKEQGQLSVSNYSFEGDSNHADAGNLNFKFTATCTEGYFIGEIWNWIFPEYGGVALTGFPSSTLYLPAHESQEVHIHGKSDLLKAGTRYLATLFTDAGQVETEYIFFKVTQELGIELMESDLNVIEREYYSLDGLKIDREVLTSGLYIVIDHLSNGNINRYKKFVK